MDADQSLEFTGEDIESAIAAGLAQLGVGPNDVLVEVIDEPNRGVFGIGAKPARVRLKLLRPPEPPKPAIPQPPAADQYEDDDLDVDVGDDDDDDESDGHFFSADEVADDELDEDALVGREVLSDLLRYMGYDNIAVRVRRTESSRPGEGAPWLLDIEGANMSSLVGRRGETLSSLQYITRLIVSRRLQRRANVIVDAGGYKSMRSDRLRKLAFRMADQAVSQSKIVTLEPMPPNERRIIHLALRSREDVETRSTGEGNARKVTIVPK